MSQPASTNCGPAIVPRWVAVCVAVTTALTPAVGSADASGDAVLAKYRAFVGWTLGDASVTALRITGKIADLSRFDETCQPGRFAQFNVGLSSGRSFLVASDGSSVWGSWDGPRIGSQG
jgi:hypothetical protein